MRTVNIAELKQQLTGCLQHVRDGEEIIIQDRSTPIGRILPFRQSSGWEHETVLVASGAMRMPTQEMDWDQFFAHPSGNISHGAAVQAALDSRGDL